MIDLIFVVDLARQQFFGQKPNLCLCPEYFAKNQWVDMFSQIQKN